YIVIHCSSILSGLWLNSRGLVKETIHDMKTCKVSILDPTNNL
ncbi:uncharacterized protein METZ01_LOCUS461190, partial [marine metagenome]